jgi:predicted Zn-dependent protease
MIDNRHRHVGSVFGVIEMLENVSKLNIVRIGECITYSSLKEIAEKILESFGGMIEEFKIFHHKAPAVDTIDALLLTMVLHEEIGGHILGITGADLTTQDEDEFYNTIFGGKNAINNVAVVSTKRLEPSDVTTEANYDLYVDRTIKVSLHEVGHNFGLTDHASYKLAKDGSLCPMSRGEFNKFGYLGYVRAIIDGRGHHFCDECTQFLKKIRPFQRRFPRLLKDKWHLH